jgi:hypothetical protein
MNQESETRNWVLHECVHESSCGGADWNFVADCHNNGLAGQINNMRKTPLGHISLKEAI